ncbi:MAG TPA: 4a-hydroxytetrahydrobiopterin dehydratase [Xanthomonadaceae bacterium]|jgi:4a-hydroxytetrahydrobiopterin dehydratase|nr:4a-hydroxytetrahydrobiopterin dehydratase [Xanthomonadaceae bacterium]
MPTKATHPEKAASQAKSGRNALHEAHCKPLKGAVHKVEPADIKRLLTQLPGWKPIDKGSAIGKTYSFEDYYHTLAFVNALAFIAHREDHHPDLGVHYNKVVVRYSTHDVGGLSMNDFICAAKVELLV